MLIHYYLIIIGRRRGAAAGGAERGGATICPDRDLWSLMRNNGGAALDSRGCLPPSLLRPGEGGDLLFLAERE